MGNKFVRRRQVVDEKYTRPQGLYQHKDVDYKKLRKLILDSKLAPCYPGDDECNQELEECPICFLYYPSLNRSRCCIKGICTECFLQMKTPNSTRPTQCPFCKTSNYAVEFRGGKTKEEKGIEQIEEQRVIEAKIRMRKQEMEDEEVRIQRRRELASSSRPAEEDEVGYETVAVENEEVVSFNEPCTSMRNPRQRQFRDEEFDLDLEDIMVMEAIWLSIQENGRQRSTTHRNTTSSPEHYESIAPTESSCSPSGGLACAIAALAERQQTNRGSSTNGNNVVDPVCRNRFSNQDENNSNGRRMEAIIGSEHNYNNGVNDDDDEVPEMMVPRRIVPESFEEQMMMAMAVSLAEAQTITVNNSNNVQGLTQQ